ncbi:hypothetical protein D9619_004444 [Psilocybe cf. subviscida]|uniref:Uncharacterized protein n=1 Tax=Psilocybe cf. subviscida TaxID=2480587 RepID=A0A8H5BPY0_9AGAR|nr:hypothetical protein D9619_004444 [Psilocybe cf. subviscida]
MSGRAPSLSPKKERATSRRSRPLERPDHKRRAKTEDEDVFIKAESEEKPRPMKTEATEVDERKPSAPDPKKEELSEEHPEPEPSEKELAAMKYLELVGAIENVPEGCNFIGSDGRIYNPTMDVQRHEYYNYHTEKEKSGGCKPEGMGGEHWCHFFREGYRNHGYRYLNADGGTFYENPDGSQYYFNRWKRWFKPSSALISPVSQSR